MGGIDDTQRTVSVGAKSQLMFGIITGSIGAVSDVGGCELFAGFRVDDSHLLAVSTP